MSGETEVERHDVREDGRRPPRAVVGSHRVEEEMFGRVFDPRILRRIWVFVRPYRRQVRISVIAVLVFTLSQLSIPMIIRHAFDVGLAKGAWGGALYAAVAAFAAAIATNYVASLVQERSVGKVAENVLFDIREAMFGHLQQVSQSFMDRTEVGRLMSRLQGDVNAMQEFLETSVISVGDLVLLFGIVGCMLWLDWQLGLLTLSVLPVLFLVRIVWLPRARAAFIAAHETNSITNGALAEAIHGVRTVQGMTRQTVNAKLYDDMAGANLRTHLVAGRYAQVLVPVVDTLTGLSMAVVVVVGGAMVLDRTLDVGVMVAFLFFIQRFFDPVRSLTMQYSVMQRAMASGQRLTEVLDVPLKIIDAPDAVTLPQGTPASVEFRGVRFAYVPGHPVLDDVSFRVEPGQTVALVGPTGSGKSSVMALLHRFYDVTGGAVIVGGHDVRQITRASLGQQIAMVLQEPFLFTGTVLENIRYNKADATEDQVIAAARAVGAHGFIERLPQGYVPILILDEATASIDSHSEQDIQKALGVLLNGRSGLVIAHRLDTIRNADRIIVLNAGRVCESGTHQELLALGGQYADLYRSGHASFDDR
jgi:ATP-binding cassette, subfamily B, multidrug efflux pump